MILLADDIAEGAREAGAKAAGLRRLRAMGLCVPEFVVATPTALEPIWNRREEERAADRLAGEIRAMLPAPAYAVRSSASIEDGARVSNAGLFKTVTDCAPERLGAALRDVVADAREKADRPHFSVIVQRQVAADLSGVTFTRDPLGGREMVIAYGRGPGAGIVGGTTRPRETRLYWNGPAPGSLPPPLIRAIEDFKRVELERGAPQDIEWCLAGDELFFLQARPITALDGRRYEEARRLDAILPVGKPFRYEKTILTESAPRPSAFTLDLLRRIHAQDGPVAAVYAKRGIAYEARDFLRIVGNELYVDRDEEVRTLFPSYGFLTGTTPRFRTFRGLARTLKNAIAFGTMTADPDAVSGALAERLAGAKRPCGSFDEALAAFLDDYRIVFETSLLAEAALKRPLAVPSTDASAPPFPREGEGLLGNSLEVSDVTPFYRAGADRSEPPSLKPVDAAARFAALRERGRLLAVMRVAELRRHLLRIATEAGFRLPERAYFQTIEEIRAGRLDEREADRRKAESDACSRFTFPTILADVPDARPPDAPFGVSPGAAEGWLADADGIVREPAILRAEALTPDLLRHFSRVKGIVAERGGALSHLAILARERGLPVLVYPGLRASGLRPGNRVRLDADRGSLDKLQDA